MAGSATTRMSSKGQIVIPEEIRDRLGLGPGVQFLVIGEGDVIILKSISTPSLKDFDTIVRKARKQARASGLQAADVTKAVPRVRGRY
jgi:AbrB family looped-hinge helix DNA binding protein